MFNRERVILTIEPQAILWYRGIVLYGSIGLPQAKFTKRTDSWRHLRQQSAYRSNDEPLPLHPSEKEIRILIADDHPIVCEGLIAVFALGRRSESCWPCSRWGGSLPALQATLPDILILDLRMPKKDGIEVVIELVPQKPEPGIIVLTHSAKEEDLRRALAAGAPMRVNIRR